VSQKHQVEAEVKNIQPLIGGVITGAITAGESECFGFSVTASTGQRYNVWVDCDPEGNGPGHLEIEKDKPKPA
jgi:hypothetical protein